MASAWTFLARLVSPRRQQEQEHGHIEDANPDVREIAVSTEKPAEESLSSADQQGGEQPSFERTDLPSIALGLSEQTGGDVDDAVEGDRSGAGEVSGQDLSDSDISLAHGAHTVEKTVDAAPARRRRRARQIARAVVAKSSPAVPSVSDETTSLDDEIRELRRQLAGKLSLQNAQLRKMLERFER
jgi:hypothetical protein